jgi:hypothetical protein
VSAGVVILTTLLPWYSADGVGEAGLSAWEAQVDSALVVVGLALVAGIAGAVPATPPRLATLAKVAAVGVVIAHVYRMVVPPEFVGASTPSVGLIAGLVAALVLTAASFALRSAPLERPCPRCRESLETTQESCPNCGYRLLAPPPRNERQEAG